MPDQLDAQVEEMSIMTTQLAPITATYCPCCGHAVPATGTPQAPVVPLPTIGGGGGIGAVQPIVTTGLPTLAALITGFPDPDPVAVPLPFLDIPGGAWRDGVRPLTPAQIWGEPLFDYEQWGLLPPWLGSGIGAPPEPRDPQIPGFQLPMTLPITTWP